MHSETLPLESSRPWLGRGLVLLTHVARIVLGVVYLWAGLLKAPDPMGFARDIAQYGIVTGPAATVFAFILVPVELVLGCALLLNFRPRLGLILSAALMVMFMGAIGYALATGQPLEGCGCFGSGSPRTPQQTLAEDAVFLALGLAGLAGAKGASRETGTGRRWKGRLLAAAAAGSGAFVVAAPHLPIDDLATRLAPGVAWESLEVALPEIDLTQGTHLVVLLKLDDDASLASMESLNAMAANGLPLVGLHTDDEEVYNQFFWTQGPAFGLHYLATSDMRMLHRSLPRVFAVRDGKVTATWSGVPAESDATRALGMDS